MNEMYIFKAENEIDFQPKKLPLIFGRTQMEGRILMSCLYL